MIASADITHLSDSQVRAQLPGIIERFKASHKYKVLYLSLIDSKIVLNQIANSETNLSLAGIDVIDMTPMQRQKISQTQKIKLPNVSSTAKRVRIYQN